MFYNASCTPWRPLEGQAQPLCVLTDRLRYDDAGRRTAGGRLHEQFDPVHEVLPSIAPCEPGVGSAGNHGDVLHVVVLDREVEKPDALALEVVGQGGVQLHELIQGRLQLLLRHCGSGEVGGMHVQQLLNPNSVLQKQLDDIFLCVQIANQPTEGVQERWAEVADLSCFPLEVGEGTGILLPHRRLQRVEAAAGLFCLWDWSGGQIRENSSQLEIRDSESKHRLTQTCLWSLTRVPKGVVAW